MSLRMQMIFFVTVFLVILGGAHVLLYLLSRFFFPGLSSEARCGLGWVLAFFSVSFVLASVLVHWAENPVTRLTYFLSGFWLGTLTNLILLFLGAWIVVWGASLVHIEMSRSFIGVGVLILASIVSVWGSWNAFHPHVREISVHIPNLPADWRGKKIVHLTDVHLGAIYRAGWLSGVVDQVNSVHPEMVVITGDLFDGMDGYLGSLVEPLNQISAPRGIYFITGNHETYLGVQEVLNTLAQTKVHVLNNETRSIEGLTLVGLSYPERGAPLTAVSTTLRRLQPEFQGKPNILLFHSPTMIDAFRSAGVNLQLSGHTHKGQQYPFGLITRLIYRGYDYGLYPMGDYTLYTSNGVGTWGPAMRVGNTPEIVSITLE